MTPKEYQAYVKRMQKKSPLGKDMALAFVIGGLICVAGQAIGDGFRAAGAMVRAMKDMEKDTRDALFNALATLFRSNIQAAVEEAREEARSEGSPLRKLTELTEKIVGKE